MAEKVTLKMTTAAAAYVRREAPREERLKAARGEINFSPADLGSVLLILSNDPDEEVKAAAIRSFREMPEETVMVLAASPAAHPRLLDILARLHHARPEVVRMVAANPAIAEQTMAFLRGKGAMEEPAPEPAAFVDSVLEEASEPAEEEAVPEEPVEEEASEEFRSKYQLAQSMGVADKIKMALTGDKEWRSILLKDANKLVSGGVVKNPRITEPEILAIVRSSVQNDEIIRVICANREWIKNYEIRKALVVNHRTPLPNALRYLGTLTEKDLATLAKSKNVSTVIATQARRMMLNKQKHR